QGRAAELLVRIDRVVATTPVVDDRTGDERDVQPPRPVVAPGEQFRVDSRDGLESVDRAACERDRVDVGICVTGRSRRASANVRRTVGTVREAADGAACRAL